MQPRAYIVYSFGLLHYQALLKKQLWNESIMRQLGSSGHLKKPFGPSLSYHELGTFMNGLVLKQVNIADDVGQ